jgi:hypothetical protein
MPRADALAGSGVDFHMTKGIHSVNTKQKISCAADIVKSGAEKHARKKRVNAAGFKVVLF